MDANVVNQVVDKLAEKIGVAAEKLAPVAQETLRQIAMLGAAYTAFGIVLLAGALCCAFLLVQNVRRSENSEHDDEASHIVAASIAGVVGLIVLAAGLSFVPEGLSRWLAPYAHLLGK